MWFNYKLIFHLTRQISYGESKQTIFFGMLAVKGSWTTFLCGTVEAADEGQLMRVRGIKAWLRGVTVVLVTINSGGL